MNSTKYCKLSTFQIGDRVLIRNFTKTSKYDPYFVCDPLEIIDIANGGCRLTLKRISNGKLYQRHPDDVKMFYNPYSDIHNDSENKCDHNGNEEQLLRDWQRLAKKPTHESYEEFDDYNDNILASPTQNRS